MSSHILRSGSAASSQQKTRLLLTMADAVEDSNTRKRHYQHRGGAVDADTMDDLIDDLERAATSLGVGSNNVKPVHHTTTTTTTTTSSNAATTATPAMKSSLESDNMSHDEEPRDNHHDDMKIQRQRRQQLQIQDLSSPSPSRQRQRPSSERRHNNTRDKRGVDQYQVQLLYSAMISYRENADLRYQLLELRNLDLRQSFVELETRYRRLETEQEAWKQSCQALQQAAVLSGGGGGMDATSTTSSSTSNNPLQTNTVPILQQELRSLCSQRNQLLQANLELRRQLKQVQIQQMQQQQQSSSTSTPCQRCHPEMFAVKQKHVDNALQGMVEQFHSSVSSIVSGDHNVNHSYGEEEEKEPDMMEESYANNDDSCSRDSSTEREENQHEDKMSLMGMHLGGDNSNHGQCRHSYHDKTDPKYDIVLGAPPTKQKSIVWSPPPPSSSRPTTASHAASPTVPGPKANIKALMTPTLTSFLSMQQKQQPQTNKVVQDITVSPRRGNGIKARLAMEIEVSARNINPSREIPQKDNQINPRETPGVTSTRGNQITPGKPPPQQQRMGRFGMLDEFGRSIAYRKPNNIDGTTSMHSTTTTSTTGTNVPSNTAAAAAAATATNKGMPLVRRKSSAQEQQLLQQQQQQRQQSIRPAPTATRKMPPQQAGQLHTAQRHRAAGPPSATAINARQMEYQMPGNASTISRSLTGSQPVIVNARHLEFSADGPPPSKPKQQADLAAKIGRGGEFAQPAGGVMRRPHSHDAKTPTLPPTSRSHVTGRNTHPVGSTAHRGGRPGVEKQSSKGGGGPLNSTPNHPRRGGNTPAHRQQPGQQQHQHRAEAKGNEEKRPQSYFQRIKKTLQQEI